MKTLLEAQTQMRSLAPEYASGQSLLQERLNPQGYAVCVVGAGAAGVSAAHALAREGVAVTLLDRGEQPGGIVRSGFSPWSQRDKFLSELEREATEHPNIVFIPGVEVGKNVPLQELVDTYHAVVLATGLQKDHSLHMPSEQYEGRGLVPHSQFRHVFNKYANDRLNWPHMPTELVSPEVIDTLKDKYKEEILQHLPLHLMNGAVVLGSGRNTIETAKSITAWTVAERLNQMGYRFTPYQVMEVGLPQMLSLVGADSLEKIGLRTPTIITRNDIGSMAIMHASRHESDYIRKKRVRELTTNAILRAADKYGFTVQGNQAVVEIVSGDDGLIKEVVTRDTVDDTESLHGYRSHPTRLVITCFGSKYVPVDAEVESSEKVIRVGSAAKVPGGYNHMRKSGQLGAQRILQQLQDELPLGLPRAQQVLSLEARLQNS